MTEELRMTDNQIVPATGSEFLLLDPKAQAEFRELYAANVGNSQMGTADLTVIKCAAGGATHFLREGEPVKEITAIIGAWQSVRAYWNPKDPNQNRPPDCFSADNFIGHGDPGGECARCPFAEFGSADKGHGQACKQVRRMLLVEPNELLPSLLRVPPTSLKPCSKYFNSLISRKILHWALITHISMESAQNKDGIKYATMKFSAGRVLTPEEKEQFRPIQAQLARMLSPTTVGAGDYAAAQSEYRRPPASVADAATQQGDEIPF